MKLSSLTVRTRFSREARTLVTEASREATQRRADRHIGTEHLLIAGSAALSRTDAALTASLLRSGLEELDRRSLAAVGVVADRPGVATHPVRRRGRPPFTEGAKAALTASVEIAERFGHRNIEPLHVLGAIAERDVSDPALRLLAMCGVDPDQFLQITRNALRSHA